MEKKLRAAFIGCGAIMQKKHLPLCAKDEHLKISALFDVNRQTAIACRDAFACPDAAVTDNAEDVFARDDIDVVFIATPNSTHTAYSTRALSSGKHVICEKPMALTYADAEEMLAASVRNRRMLHISYQNRYTNQAQYVKRLAEEGFFSEIYYAKAYALRRRAVPTWGATLSKAVQGGGSLIDVGSHALDLALWLADNYKPAYAVGTAYNQIMKHGSEANFWGNWDTQSCSVEDCALGFIVMKNGMTLTIDATYALNTPKEYEASVDLFGTTGGVQMRQQEGVTLTHELGGKMCVTETGLQQTVRSLTPDNCTMDASAREHAYFMQRLLAGESSDPSAVQACVVTKIVEGIYRSAAEKKPVMF